MRVSGMEGIWKGDLFFFIDTADLEVTNVRGLGVVPQSGHRGQCEGIEGGGHTDSYGYVGVAERNVALLVDNAVASDD